ncbi:MAG: tyrosine-protein phosphatase [Erysipelotrichaceae bacterium]|jgi:protein-tyrosine phosphatase|nr:tyrosine-protein phosphatase [Erysipelotrichaceae bacterium]
MSRAIAEIFCEKDCLVLKIQKKDFGSYTLKAFQDGEEIAAIQSEQAELPFSLDFKQSQPLTFVLKTDRETIPCGFRLLPIAGMYNVRDLGGYVNQTGKRTKWHLLYRGDQLANLKPEGADMLKSLNLKTVIDFRNPEEILKSPNLLPGSVTSTINRVPAAGTAVFAGLLQAQDSLGDRDTLVKNIKKILAKDPQAAQNAMIQQQLDFVLNPDSQKVFGQVIRDFMNAQDAPFFFHCRGGKDRTGFVAMVLLGLLGVERETLVYDYMLTGVARSDKNKLYLARYRTLTQDEACATYLYSFFEVRPEYIEAAIDAIEEAGGFEAYGRQAYGLNDQDLEVLKQIYLE